MPESPQPQPLTPEQETRLQLFGELFDVYYESPVVKLAAMKGHPDAIGSRRASYAAMLALRETF